MIKLKIECKVKKTGDFFNEITGRFKTLESALGWCDQQSKGVFTYTLKDGQGEIPREDSGRTPQRPSKRKSPAGNGTRKRRKKE